LYLLYPVAIVSRVLKHPITSLKAALAFCAHLTMIREVNGRKNTITNEEGCMQKLVQISNVHTNPE